MTAAAIGPGRTAFTRTPLRAELVGVPPAGAAAAEAVGRMLLADGNADEGAQMLEEYAIPALLAIGQDKRPGALRRLVS